MHVQDTEPATIACWKARAVLPRIAAEQLQLKLEEMETPPAVISAFEAGERDLWEVEAFFAVAPSPEALESATGVAMRVIAVEERNWVALALDGLPPVQAGRFIVHGRHAAATITAPAIGLEIEASTAFGTGHHGTTRGCLLMLDYLLRRRRCKNAADIGCGTGVLAFAFARATRAPATASDIDREACVKARINARINKVHGLTRIVEAPGFRAPAIRGAGPYDLIFANILARPLLGLMPGIAGHLASGGHAILSGLLPYQEAMIRTRALAFGLQPVSRLRLEGWLTLLFKRPNPLRRGL